MTRLKNNQVFFLCKQVKKGNRDETVVQILIGP